MAIRSSCIVPCIKCSTISSIVLYFQSIQQCVAAVDICICSWRLTRDRHLLLKAHSCTVPAGIRVVSQMTGNPRSFGANQLVRDCVEDITPMTIYRNCITIVPCILPSTSKASSTLLTAFLRSFSRDTTCVANDTKCAGHRGKSARARLR